jgi:hypothetical protein
MSTSPATTKSHIGGTDVELLSELWQLIGKTHVPCRVTRRKLCAPGQTFIRVQAASATFPCSGANYDHAEESNYSYEVAYQHSCCCRVYILRAGIECSESGDDLCDRRERSANPRKPPSMVVR